MDFLNINGRIDINMQSANNIFYNEGIFCYPYQLYNQKDVNKKDDFVQIWIGGMISYLMIDFESADVHDGLVKIIKEHGTIPVFVERDNSPGTMKPFPTFDEILKHIEYDPGRPISLFTVIDKYGAKPWDIQDHVQYWYSSTFFEKNKKEINEKLLRANRLVIKYRNTLEEEMKKHAKEMKWNPKEKHYMIIVYGNPSPVLGDALAEQMHWENDKIFEFKELEYLNKNEQ